MIPREILSQIRRIQIKTSRMATDAFTGRYHSVFRGRGIEFDEVREYQVGDDVRSIDWNVTARTGQPHVKKYVEERELTVIFLLDASSSLYFGSCRKTKNEYAAEVCSLLALSALRNNDKVGLLIFSDRVEKYVPPRKGLRHVLRVVREALYYKPRHTGTDIACALEYLNGIIPRRCICFLLSDFFDAGYEKLLAVSHKKHDIIALSIHDPREEELPAAGLIHVRDAETGEEHILDTSDARVRQQYCAQARLQREARRRLLRSLKIDAIELETGKSYVNEIVSFFKKRERRYA